MAKSDKEYIKELEGKIKDLEEKFNTNKSLVKLYLMTKMEIDDVYNLIKSTRLTSDLLSDKDDKYFDRRNKAIENGKKWAELLVYISKNINPEKKDEEDEDYTSAYEEIMLGNKK